MKILRALSVVAFLLGCLVILGAIFIAWAYLMVLTAQQSTVAGWAALVASAGLWVWLRAILQAPWVAWFHLWKWADEELDRRLFGDVHHG